MFSKLSPRKIGPRLVLSTTVLLMVSLTLVSSIIYFLFAHSLRSSDQNLLLHLRQTYIQLFKDGELPLLHNRVSPEILLVIVDRKTGRPILEKMPAWVDQDFEDDYEIDQLKKATRRLPLKKGWKNILILSGEEDKDVFEKFEYQLRLIAQEKEWDTLLPIIDNDLFEIYSAPLNDQYWMFIGNSSEEREEALSRIRYISLMVILPFVFIGLGLSAIVSHKILKPIKELAKTIGLIKDGHGQVRAQVRGSGDEIDSLTLEFNDLLDRNRSLITGMRETVDNVAHDLRTPLSRFRANAEYALINEGDQKSLMSALQDAVENSDEIMELLNAIMTVAEAESGTIKLNSSQIELKELISSVTDLYDHVAEEKQIKVETKPIPAVTILCDPRRMIQALGNILDNALKYSPQDSTVTISAIQDNKFVTLYFEDHGIGILPQDMPKIWTRLFRGDTSRSTTGHGIGLSLVQAIVNSHQGKVEVRSQVNQGSTFIVTLPICHEEVISP